MKTEKNIFIAFILNLAFSVFEFFGGIYTGSVAIISDAIHDIGDALSIGIAFFLEKKSKRQPDEKYTYGYVGYSVIGGVITTLILIFGSYTVIYNAILRIINQSHINYNGMIVFAIVGVCVNFCAAVFTGRGDSLNQKAVNLHMLEDVLGWIVVLIGAVIIKFTDLYIIDPLMSIAIAVFILVNALKNIKEAFKLFLNKIPNDICINDIKAHICSIEGVVDVHHIHAWSIDGHRNYATMHIVTKENVSDIKGKIRSELKEHGIDHVTLEFETENECCQERSCSIDFDVVCRHHKH